MIEIEDLSFREWECFDAFLCQIMEMIEAENLDLVTLQMVGTIAPRENVGGSIFSVNCGPVRNMQR